MSTLAEIKTVIENTQAAYQKRISKVAVFNEDKEPTRDINGRWHAPCDNYIWIDDNEYLAGQFLPDDCDNCKGSETIKLKILVSLFEELNAIIPGSMGKSWVQNGQEICYFYGMVSKAEKPLF